jgi:hypothetical protein
MRGWVRKVGSCCDVVLVNDSAKAIATLDARVGCVNSIPLQIDAFPNSVDLDLGERAARLGGLP